jgi:predicted aspartyl protease
LLPVYLSTSHGASNYKVDVSLSVKPNGFLGTSCKFRAVLDTGAAPLIVKKSALPKEAEILPQDTLPRLFDVQRRAIAVLGVVVGRIKMGKKEYPFEALVAEELSVDLIIGTQFIDQHVQLINARRRFVLMDHGDEVPLVDGTQAGMQRVFVVERVSIPPKCEVVVPVRSCARGLCLVTNSSRKRFSVTNGIHQIEETGYFLSKIGNFSNQTVTLLPGMVVGQAERHMENYNI